MSKLSHIKKRSGAIVPFKPARIQNAIYRAAVAVGGRDQETSKYLANQVVQLLELTCPENHVLSIEEIQDAVEKTLIEKGHSKVAKAYIIYREENDRRRREKSKLASRPSENVPWSKIWHVLDWAVTHNVHTIESLNKRIADGEFPHIVHEGEAAYEDNLITASEMIIDRGDEVKMVMISGPSSSGKTTTTIKIEQRLKKKGYKFVALNVDHYFFDLSEHPKDEYGDYDFETPQALDLELINDHLVKLCAGKEVAIPFYDFKTGTRTLNHSKLRLGEKDILLIDSLHGLYPDMSKDIPDEKKFKLFLEPLLQMKDNDGNYVRWTDIRLIRRMLRDSAHRSYDPRQTLEHWHYVRASELRNIIPYNSTADYIINSGMPYELPLYSARMAKLFAEWENKYKDNPEREDAYIRAVRLNKLLSSITPIEDDSPVPSDSVLREFIGGSCLKY
ncbi:response regulator SirA [bacterium]|nr:response regulator SirA [bacterium]